MITICLLTTIITVQLVAVAVASRVIRLVARATETGRDGYGRKTEATGRKRRRPEAREPFAVPFVYREFSHY